MESLHMNQKSFAQATGINEGTLSGIINKKTRPSIQIVEAIHNRLPNISVSWLMFGTGSMYENDSRTTPSNNNVQQQGSSDVSATSSVTTTEQPAKGGAAPASPLLFDVVDGVANVAQRPSSGYHNGEKEIIKYIDKPARKITEIRVFYDDQTYESFVPKK